MGSKQRTYKAAQNEKMHATLSIAEGPSTLDISEGVGLKGLKGNKDIA